MFLLGQTTGGESGGIGHVYSEEQRQYLAVPVAGRYPAYTEVLILIAEAAFHDGGAQVAEDTPGSVILCRSALGPRPFAGEAGGYVMPGAVFAGIVVGRDCIATEPPDFHTGEFFATQCTALRELPR